MISPSDQDGVLNAIGDKFLGALAGAVASARTDIDDMRVWRPGWFPTMHNRCLSNLIHDRLWAHLVAGVEGHDGTETIERGPRREVQVGTHFLLRIKRHRTEDRISTYHTNAALAFYLQDPPTLPGLEIVTLAGGYRWDADERAIKAPVISYRDGLDNPIWAVELSEPQDGVTAISWTPIVGPDLPEIHIGDASKTEKQIGTPDE